jgi:hypothetical protein
MKRKVVLAVALVALITVGAFAQTESDFDVTKSGNAITITKYKGTATVVNIPSRIQNTPVTTIGLGAFSRNKNITSVTIPNGVTSIGQLAFYQCTALASISIPSSVTSIGDNAFYQTALTSLTIPSGVTSIGENAFFQCYGLAGSITIPSSVKSIGSGAFEHCESLTSVTFASTIPSTGFNQGAFIGDLNAKFYATNKTNGTAGTYTRPRNTAVWTLTPAATATQPQASQYAPENDFTVTKTATAVTITKYSNNAGFGSVNIPPVIQGLPVTGIGFQAFKGMALSSVTIPKSVTLIEQQAFDGCVKLISVTFEGTLPASYDAKVGFSSFGAFPGDLRDKFYATDKTKGTPGTYTRVEGSNTWTKK